MKKSLFVLLGFLFVASASFAQKAPASPTITTESENVKVVYGQPSKKGREIFGSLVPFGQVWRTGANAATEVTFKKDVNFAGTKVKAGTYSLFTIPSSTEWTVILNSELKQWGAYEYDKIKGKNVAEVKLPVRGTEGVMEKLSITASDSQIAIEWDNARVMIPLKW
ncbi:DUF2911 domain-containing protein [Lacihabitans lacunae]|uniref:DUF2911 domain-containing protein n=1 Tax=Lacihabitans lacunae TaxID=1028214 RepID=A0ABV7YY27_9BACT